MRWSPVVPFGIPHVSTQYGTYNGYFIPKGTTVMGNAWGFSRNPQYYTSPWEFDPTRHLKQPPELDPRQYFFGYDRRICSGKELAFQFAWMMAVSILWASTWCRPNRIYGRHNKTIPIALPLDYRRKPFLFRRRPLTLIFYSANSRPVSYQCQFVPRHEHLRDKLGHSEVLSSR